MQRRESRWCFAPTLVHGSGHHLLLEGHCPKMRSTVLKLIRFHLLLLITLFWLTVLSIENKEKPQHEKQKKKRMDKKCTLQWTAEINVCILSRFVHWQLNVMLKNGINLICECCSFASPVPLWQILLFALVFGWHLHCFPEKDTNQQLIKEEERGREREKIVSYCSFVSGQ